MPSEKLTHLEPRHRAAARMRIEGRSIDYIADQLGVTQRTLYKWYSGELMKNEILRLQEDIEARWVLEKSGAAGTALQELLALATTNATRIMAVCKTCGWFGTTSAAHGPLDDTGHPSCTGPWEHRPFINESTKLDALRDVLDRFQPTARVRDLPTGDAGDGGDAGGVNLVQVFGQMPDTELAKFIKKWEAGESNGHGLPSGSDSS